MKKKITKSDKYKMLTGVCGGWAEYFNMDPTLVRVIMIILGLLKGVGIIFYIACVFIMPSPEYSGKDKSNDEGKDFRNDSSEGIHTDEEFDSFFTEK